MVNNNTIIIYSTMLAMGLILPLILAIVWKIKTKQSIVPILVGAGTFFVFAIILESIPKLIFFHPGNGIGKYIISKTWLFIGIAAMMAGIFEETGRFFAFKFALKKRNEKQTAISYGIGHGGFEAMYLWIMGGTQSLIYVFLIKSGQFDIMVEQLKAISPEQVATLEGIPAALAAVTGSTLAVSFIERVSAMLIHIACSIMVFKAVRKPSKVWLYPLAIFAHAFVDVFAGLYQTGIIKNVYIIEALLLALSIAFFISTYRLIYKNYE